MNKILAFIVLIIIACAAVLLFFDVQIDTEMGIFHIKGRIGERQAYNFDYKGGFVFKKLVSVFNGISMPYANKEISDLADDHVLPFSGGEQLKYDVYYAGIKTGESVLTFHGEKNIDDDIAYYITFNTELPFFKDYEDIYASKDTFLPVKINRRIIKLNGLLTEYIEEVYDQLDFSVEISKGKGSPKDIKVIKKDSPIYNAILLTYYYRANPHLAKEGLFHIVLPTQEFTIKASGEEKIKTPSGEYNVDVFTSEPSKFTFYLSKDDERLPVKITSHTALNYTLILSSKDSSN
jgi:hypothetical protein